MLKITGTIEDMDGLVSFNGNTGYIISYNISRHIEPIHIGASPMMAMTRPDVRITMEFAFNRFIDRTPMSENSFLKSILKRK